MRKVTGSLSKSQCTVVFLNQLRSKIGVIYGSPEVTSGERQKEKKRKKKRELCIRLTIWCRRRLAFGLWCGRRQTSSPTLFPLSMLKFPWCRVVSGWALSTEKERVWSVKTAGAAQGLHAHTLDIGQGGEADPPAAAAAHQPVGRIF